MASPSSDRETAVYLAAVAEAADRDEDVAKEMQKLAINHTHLRKGERVLLSIGYSKVIQSRRFSWRVLSSMEHTEKGNEVNTKRIKEYREKVEIEIDHICNDAILVVEGLLVPFTDTESYVFYYKMLGDYNRYLAEMESGDKKKEFSYQSYRGYMLATISAKLYLPCTHPTRLGTALNFAVYYYEIMNYPKSAIDIAQTAFDGALSGFDISDLESYKDIAEIMELLKDNLDLWRGIKKEGAGDNGGDGEDQVVPTTP